MFAPIERYHNVCFHCLFPRNIDQYQFLHSPIETQQCSDIGKDNKQTSTALLRFSSPRLGQGVRHKRAVRLAEEVPMLSAGRKLPVPCSGWFVGDQLAPGSSIMRLMKGPDFLCSKQILSRHLGQVFGLVRFQRRDGGEGGRLFMNRLTWYGCW